MSTSTAQPVVLIVDDEPAVLDALARGLRREPFQVVTALDARRALEVCADGPVAAVVSDEDMPGMRGHELLRQLRRLHPEVTRIMLTGRANVALARDLVNEAEVFRLLTKPCPVDDLAAVLRQALYARGAGVAVGPPASTAARHAALTDALDAVLASATLRSTPLLQARTGALFGHDVTLCPAGGGTAGLRGAADTAGVGVRMDARLYDLVVDRLAATTGTLVLHPVGLPWASATTPWPLADHDGRIIVDIGGRPRPSMPRALPDGPGPRVAVSGFGPGVCVADVASGAPVLVTIDLARHERLDRHAAARAAVAGVIGVARSLGAHSVARGVASDRDAEIVADLGVDIVGGPHIEQTLAPARVVPQGAPS